MKKTIFVVILGIIVGVALAACSHKDPVSNHRYMSEATFEEIGSGRIESCLINIDDDTRVSITKSGTLLLIRKFSKLDEGVYEEVDSVLGSAKDLEVTESQIDRLL